MYFVYIGIVYIYELLLNNDLICGVTSILCTITPLFSKRLVRNLHCTILFVIID